MKKYAGFWRRFIAILIDGFITSGIPSIVIRQDITSSTIHNLSFFLYLIYSVWMLKTYGATIGKMVMKIRVIKIDESKLTYSDALVRELSKILSTLAFSLGYLWMIWDAKKQTWHDKIARTIVVKA